MKFKEALEEARRRSARGTINVRAGEISDGVNVAIGTTRPVQINLSQDQAAASRVVRAAARRVIAQHRDEIEALAYK